MSADLVWLLVRNNSSFLVKRNGAQFSSEPNNLTNKHSFKYSGLANGKAIGVLPGAGNKGVTLVTKKKAAANKPAKALTTSAIKRSGVRAIAKTVRGLAAKSHYRPDLQKAALARISAIVAAQKRVKA